MLDVCVIDVRVSPMLDHVISAKTCETRKYCLVLAIQRQPGQSNLIEDVFIQMRL